MPRSLLGLKDAAVYTICSYSCWIVIFSTGYSATNLWSWSTISSVLLLGGRFLKVGLDIDNPVTANHAVPGRIFV
jgi:hypothetical protein